MTGFAGRETTRLERPSGLLAKNRQHQRLTRQSFRATAVILQRMVEEVQKRL